MKFGVPLSYPDGAFVPESSLDPAAAPPEFDMVRRINDNGEDLMDHFILMVQKRIRETRRVHPGAVIACSVKNQEKDAMVLYNLEDHFRRGRPVPKLVTWLKKIAPEIKASKIIVAYPSWLPLEPNLNLPLAPQLQLGEDLPEDDSQVVMVYYEQTKTKTRMGVQFVEKEEEDIHWFDMDDVDFCGMIQHEEK